MYKLLTTLFFIIYLGYVLRLFFLYKKKIESLNRNSNDYKNKSRKLKISYMKKGGIAVLLIFVSFIALVVFKNSDKLL